MRPFYFPSNAHSRGFTLVELSIVLVILGLLVGGVLTGQSLIRASELRSITTQANNYRTAINAFRDKYFALPGDMTNATSFWGKNNAACPTNSGTASTSGTCNGNGDGLLDYAATANATGEMFQFWNHLAQASLIEGTYTGLSGPSATTREVLLGSNVPRAKYGGAGFSVFYAIIAAGHPDRWIASSGTNLNFGTKNASGFETDQPALKPEDAWNLDTKIDDGIPSQGKVYSYKSGLNAGCTTTDTDATSLYNLSSNAITCALQFAILR